MKRWLYAVIICLLFIFVNSCHYPNCTPKHATNKDTVIETKNIKTMNTEKDTATLAGGCFWCIETTMARLKGVDTAISGYTGGRISNPTYKEVCSGLTGHAEAVQIIYNPAVIDYATLLKVFFALHNPTTLNQQGGDIGTQYRSSIFYHDTQQLSIAKEIIQQLNEQVFDNKIVTELSPATTFYKAEMYHQNYYNLNRDSNPYCTAVIDPKVAKLRKEFSHLLKD